MTQTGMDSLPGAFQEKAVAGSNHRHFHLVECSLLDLTRNVDAQIRTERSSGHFLSCQCCGGEVYDNDDGLFVLPLPSQTRDQLRVTCAGPALQCPAPFHLRVTFLHFVRHPYHCWTYGWCGSRGQTAGLAKSILPGSFPQVLTYTSDSRPNCVVVLVHRVLIVPFGEVSLTTIPASHTLDNEFNGLVTSATWCVVSTRHPSSVHACTWRPLFFRRSPPADRYSCPEREPGDSISGKCEQVEGTFHSLNGSRVDNARETHPTLFFSSRN